MAKDQKNRNVKKNFFKMKEIRFFLGEIYVKKKLILNLYEQTHL